MARHPRDVARRDMFGGSAGAALAAVAGYHGLDLADGGLRLLVDDLPDGDLFYLLHAARQAGFEAVPLEGDYEHLPEVPRPTIVAFRAPAGRLEFRVLFEIDGEAAVVADPATGERLRLGREDFSARWTGDAVQLVPDAAAMGIARTRIAASRDPRARIARLLGLGEGAGDGRFFLPGAAAAVALAGVAIAHHEPLLAQLACAAVGGCLVVALWSALLMDRCRACSRTARLVGDVPVAWAGVALYTGTLAAAAFLPMPGAAVGVALAGAAGVHLGLMSLLAREGLTCAPCAATAILAAWAAALWMSAGGVPAWAPLAALVGAVATPRVAKRAVAIQTAVIEAGALRLAGRTAAEGVEVPAGHAAVVVYKRAGCAQCSFFDAVLGPAIEAEYGELVTIEARSPGDAPTVTPLIVVRGAAIRLALLGLPEEGGHERLRAAIEAARSSGAEKLTAMKGLWVSLGDQ